MGGQANSYGVLGPLEVRVGGEIVNLPANKHRALLAGMLLSGPEATFAQLTRWTWDEQPPVNPRAALHTYIRRVRQQLGDAALVRTTPSGYRLEVSPDEVDLRRFRRKVVRAGATAEYAEQVRLLRAALDEWRGMPLQNVSSQRLRDEFLESLLRERRDARERLFEAELRLGRVAGGQLVAEIRAAIADDPLREKYWQSLMTALYRTGRQAEALGAYHQVRGLLIDELGVEPGQDLRELHGRILAQDPGLDPPPAQPGPAPAAIPAQLPPQPSLVGRRSLVERVSAGLRPTGQRASLPVVVLTGAPGVGKTALALHVAHEVRDRFPDGQLYVNLGGHTKDEPLTAERALRHLLTGLGVPAGEIPLDWRDQEGLYRSWLADKRVLVVLDNAVERYTIDALLPGAQGCAVIITSRDRYHRLIVSNEAQIFAVDTLDSAESAKLVAGLLSNRSIEIDPRVAQEIGDLCGHLPLALRIAAANLVIRPESEHGAYVDELRRGNRLAALSLGDGSDAAVSEAFSLSYRALSPDDQRTFGHLGLLPGRDFSAAAVAVLTGTSPEAAVSSLARLVSASLVQRTAGGRYEVHDLLRQYAAALLASSHDDDQQAVERLALWYVRLANQAASVLHAEFVRMAIPDTEEGGKGSVTDLADAKAALNWLNTERENLIAMALSCAHAGPEMVAWHLADVLRGYFWTGKYRPEWREVTEVALRTAAAAGNQAAVAAMHRSLGNLYNLSGDYRLALEHQSQCLRLHRALGLAEEELATLINAGHTNLNLARPDAVRHLSQEALAIADRIGSERGKDTALVLLGSAARLDGDRAEAISHLEQALAIATVLGLRHVEASSTAGLGFVHQEMGEAAAAQQYFARVLRASEGLGSSYDRSNALYGMALTYSDLGDSALALDFASQARESFRRAGERTREVDTLRLMSRIFLADDRPDDALASAEQARRAELDLAKQNSSHGDPGTQLNELIAQIGGR